MKTRTWKEIAEARIAKVARDNPAVTDEKELRKLISKAYPFGVREHWPYKAWLSAVKEFFERWQEENKAIAYSPADYEDMPLFK